MDYHTLIYHSLGFTIFLVPIYLIFYIQFRSLRWRWGGKEAQGRQSLLTWTKCAAQHYPSQSTVIVDTKIIIVIGEGS